MHLSPDEIVLWQYGILRINATIAITWLIMIFLALGSRMATHKLSANAKRTRWQNLLEIVVTEMEQQIAAIGVRHAARYLGFVGTLFLFVATASLLTLLPGYIPPTSSLSTTAALALCVMAAVPVFGIREQGLRAYLASYFEPTFIMFPFNVISELSRTIALAVRLFGNMMSGVMITGILLTITPLLFPAVMTALGLLTGMVQAYIFSVLAAVYIAAALGANAPAPAALTHTVPS